MIDFKKSITTRNGMEVKFYEVFEYYINGAYFDDNKWKICSWTVPHGYCILALSKRTSKYDLINNEPYKQS